MDTHTNQDLNSGLNLVFQFYQRLYKTLLSVSAPHPDASEIGLSIKNKTLKLRSFAFIYTLLKLSKTPNVPLNRCMDHNIQHSCRENHKYSTYVKSRSSFRTESPQSPSLQLKGKGKVFIPARIMSKQGEKNNHPSKCEQTKALNDKPI